MTGKLLFPTTNCNDIRFLFFGEIWHRRTMIMIVIKLTENVDMYFDTNSCRCFLYWVVNVSIPLNNKTCYCFVILCLVLQKRLTNLHVLAKCGPEFSSCSWSRNPRPYQLFDTNFNLPHFANPLFHRPDLPPKLLWFPLFHFQGQFLQWVPITKA